MKSSRRSISPFPISHMALSACLTFNLFACGVEVGNPGKPVMTPATTANGVAPESMGNIAQLVARQHDEALLSAIESYADESLAAPELALIPKKAPDQECTDAKGAAGKKSGEDTDNSVQLNRIETNEFQTLMGEGTRERIVQESYSRQFLAQIAAKETSGSKGAKQLVACRGPKNGIIVDWSAVLSMEINSQTSRSHVRKILDASGTTLQSESSLVASGVRQSKITRSAYTANSLSLLREVAFKSDLKVEQSGLESELSQISSAEPLMIEEIYGPASRLQSVRIKSGTVASTRPTGEKLLLRYENLELSTSGTCQPKSGSVKGEIYISSAALQPSDSFTLIFGPLESILRYANGEEKYIELESCALSSTATP